MEDLSARLTQKLAFQFQYNNIKVKVIALMNYSKTRLKVDLLKTVEDIYIL